MTTTSIIQTAQRMPDLSAAELQGMHYEFCSGKLEATRSLQAELAATWLSSGHSELHSPNSGEVGTRPAWIILLRIITKTRGIAGVSG